MNISTPIVLISASLGKDENKDKVATTIMRDYFLENRMQFISVIGVYKGQSEKSFAVALTKTSDLQRLQGLAKEFGQESILFVDSSRFATLIYSNGNQENLGMFSSATRAEVQDRDSYTTDGHGKYWVTK